VLLSRIVKVNHCHGVVTTPQPVFYVVSLISVLRPLKLTGLWLKLAELRAR